MRYYKSDFSFAGRTGGCAVARVNAVDMATCLSCLPLLGLLSFRGGPPCCVSAGVMPPVSPSKSIPVLAMMCYGLLLNTINHPSAT